MQVYHYEAFIVNYALTGRLTDHDYAFMKPLPVRLLVWVAALAFSWGVVEVGLPSRLNFVPSAVIDDKIVPVLLRLKQLSKEDGTSAGLRERGEASTIVFSPQLEVSVFQPTWTSQGTLLDIGSFGLWWRVTRRA